MPGLPSAPPGFPVASAQQGDLLEGYAGIQFSNWEFSFGKQSLWWGPDQGGAMLFSNNAEPIEMFAINRVSPFTLPSILRVAGPIRVQFVLGRLNGQNWVFSANTGFTGSWDQPLSDQPFIEGAKISLKPIPSLEVGMGITTIFAGSGVPFTLHKLEQVLFPNGEGPPGTANDPFPLRSSSRSMKASGSSAEPKLAEQAPARRAAGSDCVAGAESRTRTDR